MDKKLKDYLHLYLGCKAEISNHKAFIIDIITPSSLTMCYSNLATIKPILRPLSDVTEEEQEIYRKIAMQALAACDSDMMRYDAETTIYLLKQGFDLFGLIESGLAIDKTKLNE